MSIINMIGCTESKTCFGPSLESKSAVFCVYKCTIMSNSCCFFD